MPAPFMSERQRVAAHLYELNLAHQQFMHMVLDTFESLLLGEQVSSAVLESVKRTPENLKYAAGLVVEDITGLQDLLEEKDRS